MVEEVENLEISIHVISGSPGFDTMRLMGMSGTKSIVILVDSRSTHNLIPW